MYNVQDLTSRALSLSGTRIARPSMKSVLGNTALRPEPTGFAALPREFHFARS
jgi:hypothetical protein